MAINGENFSCLSLNQRPLKWAKGKPFMFYSSCSKQVHAKPKSIKISRHSLTMHFVCQGGGQRLLPAVSSWHWYNKEKGRDQWLWLCFDAFTRKEYTNQQGQASYETIKVFSCAGKLTRSGDGYTVCIFKQNWLNPGYTSFLPRFVY